jgi:CubicO group peptidase (beta-lactamase class C family)
LEDGLRNGWWKSACLGVAGLIVAFAPATAQTASLDPGKVQAWADSFFKETMSKTKVPGAVIVVVDHGRIIVLKGYGVTTPVGGKPIDPQTTLFR